MPPLLSGSICKIEGLMSRPELNGDMALVGAYVPEAGRYEVEDVISKTMLRVKAANLVLQDPVLQDTKLQDTDVCHTYCFKLMERFCVKGLRQPKQWPESLFLGISEAMQGDHQLVLLNLNPVGHMCTLEVLQTPAGLRGRLLQCWVRQPGVAPAGVKLNPGGFTAREWQAREGFRWMNEAELLAFCENLQRLRSLIETLVTKELLKSVPGKRGGPRWARDILERGTAQRPGMLEYADAYSKKQRDQGLEPRFAVFSAARNSPPEQVLDFPIEDGVAILRLGRELFGNEFGSDVWFRGVQYHQDPEGWQFMVGRVKS